MTIPLVSIDGSLIKSQESFHDEFSRVFGFPDFYGRNRSAWVDCLTYLDEDDGMRSITIDPGQVLTIQIENYNDLKSRHPDLLNDIIEGAAFVNWRRIEMGGTPVLALSFRNIGSS